MTVVLLSNGNLSMESFEKRAFLQTCSCQQFVHFARMLIRLKKKQ